jgi:hypothetical protein
MAPVDTPTAAQVAQLIESMSNQKEDMREVKTTLAHIGQSIVTIAGMQRDLAHMDEKVRNLYARDDQRGPEIVAVDKRVSNLEKWNKILGVFTITALGLVGWGIQSVAYLYRLDSRVAMLELTTKGESIERAMEVPRITGGK